MTRSNLFNIIYLDRTFFLCQPDRYIFEVDVEKMNYDSGCLKGFKSTECIIDMVLLCFDRMIPKNDLRLGRRND